MTTEKCSSCQKINPPYHCGICNSALCKKCAQFTPGDAFLFLDKIPQHLSHRCYCVPCFDQTVSPELETYEDNMNKARAVIVFDKRSSKETRNFKRISEPLLVKDCDDEAETLLRLAFKAVIAGFNGIVDVEITSRKVKLSGYQTSKWDGFGRPVHIDPRSRLARN